MRKKVLPALLALAMLLSLLPGTVFAAEPNKDTSNVTAAPLNDVKGEVEQLYEDASYKVTPSEAKGSGYDMDVKVEAKDLAYHAGDYNGQTQAYWVGISFMYDKELKNATGYEAKVADTIAELDSTEFVYKNTWDDDEDEDGWNIYLDAAEGLAAPEKAMYIKLDWYTGGAKSPEKDLSNHTLATSTIYKIDFSGITLKHQDPTTMTATLAAVSPVGVQGTNTLKVSSPAPAKAVKYYYKVVTEQTQVTAAQSEHTIYDFASNGYTEAKKAAVEGDGVQVKVTDAQWVEVYAVSTSGKIQAFACVQGQADNYVPAPEFVEDSVYAENSQNKTFKLTLTGIAEETTYKIYSTLTGGDPGSDTATASETEMTVTLSAALEGLSKEYYIAAVKDNHESARTKVTLNRYQYKTATDITKIEDMGEGNLFTALEAADIGNGGDSLKNAKQVDIEIAYAKTLDNVPKLKLTLADGANAKYSTGLVTADVDINQTYSSETGIELTGFAYAKSPATVVVKVTAEDGSTNGYYKIVVTMVDPATDSEIKTLTVTDASDAAATVAPSVPAAGGTQEEPAALTATIPYTKDGKTAKFSLTVSDGAKAYYSESSFEEASTEAKDTITTTATAKGNVSGTGAQNITVYIKVVAEDEKAEHTTYYKLTISMEDASVNNAITGLKVTNAKEQPTVSGAGSADKENPTVIEVVVPYTENKKAVTVTDMTFSDGATAKWSTTSFDDAGTAIDGGTFTTVSTPEYKKEAEQNTGLDVYITVTAQDEKTAAYYKLNIKVEAPDMTTDVTGITLGDYTAEVAADATPETNNGSSPDKALEYTVSVPNDFTSGKLVVNVAKDVQTAEYKATDPTSSWSDGTKMTDGTGTALAADTVAVSGDAIWIKVMAQDPDADPVYYKVTVEKVEVTVAETVEVDAQLGSAKADLTGKEESFKTEGDTVTEFAEQKSVEIATSETYTEELAQAKKDLKNKKPDYDDGEVSVRVVTTLEVEVSGYNTTTEQEVLTVDITPMYHVIVTDDGDSAKKISELDDKYVELESGEIDTDGKEVTVTIPIPDKMAGDTASTNDMYYVTHTKDDGTSYEYGVKLKGDKGSWTVSIENTHGFSPFTVKKSTDSVASIGAEGSAMYYKTLQDAVNAVENNGTIEILKELSDGVSVTVNKAITIKIKAETGKWSGVDAEKVKALLIAGSNVSLEVTDTSFSSDHTITFTFTAKSTPEPGPAPGPSGPSSSGVSNPTTVNSASAVNGSFTVSNTSAKAGDTVKIAPKADKGYVVDEVTVTDKNGKAVEVTKNDDGTYSFVMPKDTPVSVSVTFLCDGGDSCITKVFPDVDQSEWYHKYVDYAVRKGIMKGNDDGTFAPETPTTRAELVTMLWRLEKEPKAEASSFKDVQEGDWFADPVAWAAANKIVDGYDDGNFGPDDYVTREQAVAILYRYAKTKGYDVTAQDDLADFTDAGKLSFDDAKSGMRWAVAVGLIKGETPTTLEPVDDTTRAEVATILMRFCENIVK